MTNSCGLYRSEFEHDACGVGFIAHIKGQKSHSIVSQALDVLKNLRHRGAVGADPLQGDGAGILIQIPDQLYRDDMMNQGVKLPPAGEYGVGMVFLPQEAASRHACEEEIERAVAAEGQMILGWRDVPIDRSMPMSPVVREKEPVIRQVFIGHSPDVLVTDALERKLYIIRKRSSIAIANLHLKHCKEFYICSCSARTVVYKGQLLATQVGIYYRDLQDARCISALAMIHQRFSTNTFPQWQLAHPFRYIAHNGEINTLRGNFNWILAREKHISSPVLGDDLKKLWPLIFQGQSDSASFDNAFELLTMAGYSLAQAALMLIPEAWEKNKTMNPRLRALYEYNAAMMEPWDGPAAVAFTNGRQIGAILDRNGLRPARYLETKDDLVILASESGVGLVSPPPHHDIYSIEDLAQLILDLKYANPHAGIGVKLVSQAGIGTVAAGVAKCKADHIVVSGHDGGTGAAPATSIKHAGSAWEIGLAEVEQTLVMNNLRGRVRLQVDGQIKTGRDVVIGAMLGADEFGFGTTPLVAMGCLMMRKCQKNTCPAGIATQDPALRRQFVGRPEHVENYFHFVAREVREIMAQLGVAKFDDLIGHVEYLRKRSGLDGLKASKLSLEKILYKLPNPKGFPLLSTEPQDHELEKAFDLRYAAELSEALKAKRPMRVQTRVGNTDRAVGTMLSGIAAQEAQGELPDDFALFELVGTAGQSFGAFLGKGISLRLTGGANDYVGKGLSGGSIAVKKSSSFDGRPNENVIAGNACLYGATSGEAFISGVVGERFAVRNSGASTVAEGCGDHGCEYMTGGTAVILGRTGRNFAAGMSGGIAYVWDPNDELAAKMSDGAFELSHVLPASEQGSDEPLHYGQKDEVLLKRLVERHAELTGSPTAREMLADWPAALGRFTKVFPLEYKHALASLKKEEN